MAWSIDKGVIPVGFQLGRGRAANSAPTCAVDTFLWQKTPLGLDCSAFNPVRRGPYDASATRDSSLADLFAYKLNKVFNGCSKGAPAWVDPKCPGLDQLQTYCTGLSGKQAQHVSLCTFIRVQDRKMHTCWVVTCVGQVIANS